MEQIEVIDIVRYQIGVDMFGFPIYHYHIFADRLHTIHKTKSIGKNMTKNKIIHKIKQYIFSVTK